MSNLTLVKVVDGNATRTYWVAKKNPEKAKQEAIKKHRQRVGLGRMQAWNDHDLTAEIVEPTL